MTAVSERPALTAAATLQASVRRHARSRPDHVAVVCGTDRATYSELDRRGACTAGALAAAGVRAGDRVAHFARDSVRYHDLLLGCATVGAVLVPVDWRLTAAEVEYVLRDSGAVLLFHDGAPVQHPVAVRLDDGEFEGWRDRHGPFTGTENAGRDTPVVQMYTSGTTGSPKGVVLAQRSFFAVAELLAEHGLDWIDWRPDDRSLVGLPGFHIGGLWWATQGLNAGVTNVLLPVFDSRSASRTVREHGITTTCMVPAMLRALLDEPGAGAADFATLRKVVYGGSPIPESLLRRCIEVFGCDLAQIYGLTETGNTAVCLPPAQHVPGGPRLTAAGRPYPGVGLRVVDRDGADLPPGEIGQVYLRSPAAMVEYWNRPERTAETLVDGWVRTGDAGFTDDEGYLFIRDRIDDMIIVGGENVYPAEVENAVCAHSDVVEAAVVGGPDQVLGEQVHAFVVAVPNSGLTATALRSFLRGCLARYKIPATVSFVDTVPRNPSGKILRRLLRDPLWAGADRAVVVDAPEPATGKGTGRDTGRDTGKDAGEDAGSDTAGGTVEETIAAIWREVLGVDAVGTHDDFFDLGGHSLQGMSVISRIIAVFDLSVPIQALFDRPTVAGLAAEVERLLIAEIDGMDEDEVAAELGSALPGGDRR